MLILCHKHVDYLNKDFISSKKKYISFPHIHDPRGGNFSTFLINFGVVDIDITMAYDVSI